MNAKLQAYKKVKYIRYFIESVRRKWALSWYDALEKFMSFWLNIASSFYKLVIKVLRRMIICHY